MVSHSFPSQTYSEDATEANESEEDNGDGSFDRYLRRICDYLGLDLLDSGGSDLIGEMLRNCLKGRINKSKCKRKIISNSICRPWKHGNGRRYTRLVGNLRSKRSLDNLFFDKKFPDSGQNSFFDRRILRSGPQTEPHTESILRALRSDVSPNIMYERRILRSEPDEDSIYDGKF